MLISQNISRQKTDVAIITIKILDTLLIKIILCLGTKGVTRGFSKHFLAPVNGEKYFLH